MKSAFGRNPYQSHSAEADSNFKKGYERIDWSDGSTLVASHEAIRATCPVRPGSCPWPDCFEECVKVEEA